jgi:hypothetical protein
MKEMQEANGVYSKWYPAKDHEEERAKFFSDRAGAIRTSALFGICCLVRLDDLKRFNAEHALSLQPYPLAAYGCMILAGKKYPRQPIELVFDHVEKISSKLDQAQAYADSDRHHASHGIFEKIAAIGLPKKITWRDVDELQAADFWTWEYRKNHERLNDWWALEDRPKEWGDEQWEHLNKFVEENYGGFTKHTRKSAQALLLRPDFRCMIWHYEELSEAHKARGGIW